MKPNERIINDYLKTYLIGAMEKTQDKDNGRGWRDRLRPELEARLDKNRNPIYVFDPTQMEAERTGYDVKEFHEKLEDWIASGNRDKVKEHMDMIWRGKTYLVKGESGKAELHHMLGDNDYVRNSDFLICLINEGDMPCGTYGEAHMAYERNAPIYLIQTMALSKYNKSFLGWVLGSGGEIFPNQKQLLEFLDTKYKLKRRKDND
jgi:hypothetical protein